MTRDKRSTPPCNAVDFTMADSETFHVRLDKRDLTFCAAHFITFENGQCERLHGHNYGVSIEVEGPLGEAGYVVDFLALMDIAREITRQLDHHVLLPTNHPLIDASERNNEVIAKFSGRRWVFPADDCVLLPLMQTTAELLAQYIASDLKQRLAGDHNCAPRRLRVEVDECQGQRGVYEWKRGMENSE